MNDDMGTCRECGHFKFLHVPPIAYDAAGNKIVGDYHYSQRCDPQNEHGCDCEEYVPEDNLDYIEWLAGKRGLIK